MFAELWLPDYFELDFGPTLYGVAVSSPATARISITPEDSDRLEQVLSAFIREEIAKLQKADNSTEYSLLEIRSSLYGWSRVLFPSGNSAQDPWTVVCPDNILRTYQVKNAPAMSGVDSAWLRMEDGQHASNLHLAGN